MRRIIATPDAPAERAGRRTGGRPDAALSFLWFIPVVLLLLVLLPVRRASAQSRHVFEDAPLREVIAGVERATGYRFLYRDALVGGKKVTFAAATDDLLDAFDRALRPLGLQLRVDAARKQVFLTEAERPSAPPSTILTGEILDAETGARLPFATVAWRDGERLRGTAANEAGVFHLRLDGLSDRPYLELTASHLGYESRRVRLTMSRLPASLPIRLTPQPLRGSEVVVSGTLLAADLDTTWHHLLRPALSAPLGEGNVLRALQNLPSVTLSTALTQGLNVRGSKADGFQVLLDGVRIYNQNHFFGLFDAFNEDALQAVAFYYGIAPARFEAPPGGTLSFVTRTGSQTGFRKKVGLSNTAVKGTLEGPWGGGRGSWLLSGRLSYLNAIDWFNNAAIIEQGLNVVRETSLSAETTRLGARALAPGASSARFFDLHGKFYHESERGRRTTLNVYLGGDEARHEAERFVERAPGGAMPHLERRTVETRNDWGNLAVSLRDQRALGDRAFARTTLALSRYFSRFSKDDFTYVPMLGGPAGMGPPVVAPFAQRNELVELKLAQSVDAVPRFGGAFSAGYDLHRFDVTYAEDSARRARFDVTQTAVQFDAFAQYDARPLRALELNVGLRGHYFSNGRFVRLSPRLWGRLFPEGRVSFGLGYSRNHQFLHRLFLEQAEGSDVWIMSTAAEPPGSVDHVTAGVYVKASEALFFQAEVYRKDFENLRQHENGLLPPRTPGESVLLKPWLPDNTARAQGLELMLRYRLGPARWTSSFTWSKTEIRNDALLDGAPFFAPWDRRHQFSTRLEWTMRPGLTGSLAWHYASGTPNALAFSDPDEPPFLGDYHRMDVSLEYRRRFGGRVMEARVGVFNLYDRNNPWYRAPVAVVGQTQHRQRLSFVNVDVYDLGFQPSFSLSFTF